MPENTQTPRREWALAGAIYAAFLGLAAVRHYLTGQGLFFQVVWDPVSVYSFFTSDHFALDAIKAGFYPLWDHTRGLGAPHVIPTGGNIDYPLRVLAYLMDSRAGWEVYILLRLWLAGLFGFLCAREMAIRFRGALATGLAFMLCGYFREFQNLPDVNVVLLLPLLLFLIMRLARTRRLGYLLLLFFIIPQLDNSPESTFYVTVYGSLFFFAFGAIEWRRQGRPLQGWAIFYLSVMWVAVIQNGVALFPFTEYWKHSWHFHPETLGGLHVPLSAGIAFATPAFDFWMTSVSNLSLQNIEQLTIIPAYVGVVTLGLAAVGLLRLRRLPSGLWLTTLLGIALAGIIFGVPPFAWLARLPLVRYFQNFRYAQPFLAFSVALLAGAGVDALDGARGRRALAVVGAVMGLWLGWHVVVFRHELRHTPLIGYALGLAAVGAVIAAVGLLLARKLRPGLVNLPTVLVVALGLELALYFSLAGPIFGPAAYQFDKPPAVDFITARGGKPFRIYATDPRILHPNLAGVYGLSDLRDQTPLYLADYADLFATVSGLRTPEEIMNHFLSGGRFFFELDLAQAPENLLDLLNVRYVLSREPLGKRTAEISPTLQVLAPEAQFFQHITAGALGGVARSFYLLHAPGRMSFIAGDFGGVMESEAGLMDNAAGCPGADGVFMVAVGQLELAGSQAWSTLTFARFVAPGESGRLLPFGKMEMRNTFSSLPGPRNDNRCDYGAWSDPVWTRHDADPIINHRRQQQDQTLNQIYDREYRVYENTDVAPRVFAVKELRPLIGLDQLLTELALLDPRAAAFTDSAPIELSVAEISEVVEQPGRISFRSRSDGPAFAVISNLYFPGWKAFIDGGEVPIHRADAILQGIALPMGDRRVELVYDPMSWHPGWWSHLISWAGLVALAVWIFVRRRPV